jgi:hypothetical protein
MWFVDAALDHSADTSYDITIKDVDDLMAYQINMTTTGEKFIWKDKEYKNFAYI